MEPGPGNPVVVSGAPPRTSLWVEVIPNERAERKFITFPDKDEIDGMDLSTHTDAPFNHIRAIEEARKLQTVTHCFTTGYYVTSPTTGKPVWSNHVSCSGCGYFDTDVSYEAMRERWGDRSDCDRDNTCPISKKQRAERQKRRARSRT